MEDRVLKGREKYESNARISGEDYGTEQNNGH